MKSNKDKLVIMAKIIKNIKNKNLIDHQIDSGYPTAKCNELDIEYLQTMLHHRIIAINKDNPKNVWSYYCVTANYIQLVFPSPPFSTTQDSSLFSQLENFIVDTRNCISEIIKLNPPKIIIDLRNNYGGYIFAFYDALLPLLPKNDNQIFLRGVNIMGEEIMKMEQKSTNKMVLTINNVGENHVESHDLHPIISVPKCEVEVWVNSRSASSSEVIMIVCEQAGYRVIGGPTMGLTTGMEQISIGKNTLCIPNYIFVDKHGKKYLPHDSTRNIGQNTLDENLCKTAKIYQSNILTKIPKNLLCQLNESTSLCVFNNIHCEYFQNNYHASIDIEENCGLYYLDTGNTLYIYVPKKTKVLISSVLDEFQDSILAHKKNVLIDIRNSMLEEINIFDGLFKPWKIESKDGKTAYFCNQRPYILGKKCNKIGKYSDIKAQFWVNKHSTNNGITSSAFLLYAIEVFGLYEKSELNKYYQYGQNSYEEAGVKYEIYTTELMPQLARP